MSDIDATKPVWPIVVLESHRGPDTAISQEDLRHVWSESEDYPDEVPPEEAWGITEFAFGSAFWPFDSAFWPLKIVLDGLARPVALRMSGPAQPKLVSEHAKKSLTRYDRPSFYSGARSARPDKAAEIASWDTARVWREVIHEVL
jgi:hypothetical protein